MPATNIVWVAGFLLFVEYFGIKSVSLRTEKRERVMRILADVSLFVLFGLSVVELTLGSYNPFIYFKF